MFSPDISRTTLAAEVFQCSYPFSTSSFPHNEIFLKKWKPPKLTEDLSADFTVGIEPKTLQSIIILIMFSFDMSL